MSQSRFAILISFDRPWWIRHLDRISINGNSVDNVISLLVLMHNCWFIYWRYFLSVAHLCLINTPNHSSPHTIFLCPVPFNFQCLLVIITDPLIVVEYKDFRLGSAIEDVSTIFICFFDVVNFKPSQSSWCICTLAGLSRSGEFAEDVGATWILQSESSSVVAQSQDKFFVRDAVLGEETDCGFYFSKICVGPYVWT